MSNNSGRIDTVLDPPPDASTELLAPMDSVLDEKTSPGSPPVPRAPARAHASVADATPIPHARANAEVSGGRSPLVGRDEELAAMQEVIGRAIDFQTPQLITVLGNQGTGKTRLVSELLRRGLKSGVRVLAGRAEKNGPRHGVITSFLRERFEIQRGDAIEITTAKFRREVASVFADDRLTEVLYLLGEYLGLSLEESPFIRVLGENAAQQEELRRTVLRRFVELDAEQSPLVIALDDIHCADDESLELLSELGARLGGSPVVLVVCARPELVVRFSNWGQGTTDHLRLDLRNLEPDDAETMLGHLLGRCESVPQDAIDDAIEMTGGNPQFIEQLVRLYLSNGTVDTTGPVWHFDADRAAETELPISVAEAIEARIADLQSAERDVLEKGAVFGNVFWVGAVVALSRLEREQRSRGDDDFVEPDTLDGIDLPSLSAGDTSPLDLDWSERGDPVRRQVMEIINELVERDYLLRLDPEDSTIAGDIELVFKHNLERELVARSTEARCLERYHRTAAQWFETKLSERSEEQLEFLAQLYERGGDRRRAAHCYLAGADKANARYSNAQAVELYEKGLSMLEEHDAVAWLSALHNCGSVLDRIGQTEKARRQFEEMMRRAWLFDNRAKGGAAHGRLGRIYRGRAEYDRAMAHLRTAQDLFAQSGDQRGVAGTLDDMGQIHWLRGAYGQALEFCRQGLSIRRAIGDRRSLALSLANIGRVLHDSGSFKAARGQFTEALRLRRDVGDMSGVAQSLCALGMVRMADGNHERALEMFTEAHQIAIEIGERLGEIDALSRLGECKAAMGAGGEAVTHLKDAVALSTELGDRAGIAENHRRLAEVQLMMGDAATALTAVTRALSAAEAIGARAQIGICHSVLGECVAALSSAPDQLERADQHYRKAVDILAGMKNEMDLARCYRSYGAFCARVGKSAEAQKLSRRSEEIFGRLRGTAGHE